MVVQDIVMKQHKVDYYWKKFILTSFLLLYMTVAALAYGPEGNGVYRGYIINNNTAKYLVVEIYNKNAAMVVYQKRIPPKRPVKMPYKPWGDGFIPDHIAYKDLLEHYYNAHGQASWIQNVLLYPGVEYIIRYRYSDEEQYKESVFILFYEDVKEGPYVIEIE